MDAGVTIRVVTEADAGPQADLLISQRGFLAATDPIRPDDYYTEAGQRRDIAAQLDGHDQRTVIPCVVHADGVLAGRVNVFHIVHKSFRSGTVGYWIRQDYNGRGVATAAVAEMITLAFGTWGLHRLEAGTLVDNQGSQRVLRRNGFTEIGLAPRYLYIAGAWRDHILFQRLNEP